ncbi:hypothetical protein ACQPZP_26440 [Spirillospora sp. CA-142024]|uniref:hypothetical protein n=1 Tax=Spirillospora sp. CA-142024 TaxID=3240036 RepID=UPI003D8E64D5
MSFIGTRVSLSDADRNEIVLSRDGRHAHLANSAVMAQVAHVFVAGGEITGVLDWTEAAQGDALFGGAVRPGDETVEGGGDAGQGLRRWTGPIQRTGRSRRWGR